MLSGDLVHAESAGGDPGAGVGQFEDLEQLLDGAVLTPRAMQSDEDDVGTLLAEPANEVLAHVDADGVVTERA